MTGNCGTRWTGVPGRTEPTDIEGADQDGCPELANGGSWASLGDVREYDVASVLVWFIEDRNGKALVRLPNGSKTSLPYECLDFVVSTDDLPRPATTDDLSHGPLLEPYRRRTADNGES
jgi:hypothetical protein